ncbi:2-(trimethylamino)ethylphosphonate dioxygenase-like isoform X2 [Amphiura filiformis]|uniref:2-(trimethylamino)ethylphosphonate dioxygenase-like isoform X2 n=1 Tax=Amphiura filiformis TaxID=82378 RepID=UPI003B21FECD
MSLHSMLRGLISSAIKPRRHLLHKNCIQRSLQDGCHKNLQRNVRLVSSYKGAPSPVHHNVKRQHFGVSTLDASSDPANATNAQLEMDSQSNSLQISWSDGFRSRYHSIWLRNHCQCASCKQLHSGQKLIEQHDIPRPCTLKSTQIQDGTHLQISWKETAHEGLISLEFLRENSYGNDAIDAAAGLRDNVFFKGPIEEFDYKDISSCKKSFFRWLQCLDVYGIALVMNVPTELRQVAKVAELIAPVQNTLYGEIFDVVATDEPINVAYSTAPLGYHMDLMYYESPPGLQLLHCLRFDDSAHGGESLFLDVFHSATEFRRQYPHHFDTLTRVPVTFHKNHFERERPAAYMYQRPHITVNPQGQMTSVAWSPPFEGPLKVREEDVEPYYEAYHTFAAVLENSPIQVEHRMRTGQCIIFNNRRILHARRKFTLHNGEQRHYQGCYVNIDDFRNSVQVAYIQHGREDLAKRNGNQCWL